MSFILDALKKSENERQRQSGPGLFEAKVAPPKPRWPAWAFALAALLVINIGVVIWLTLRQPSRSDVVAAVQPPQTPLPVARMPTVQAIQAPAANSTPAPAAGEAVDQAAQQSSARAASENAAASASEEPNPDDYAPAVEPAPNASPTAPLSGSHVTRGTVEGLPTYDEMAGRPSSGLPNLRLDLHVYAAKPQDRFIFLNMHRLREGDALPEGVRVETITPDGAVLSFRGSKFVLDRD